MSQRLTIKGQVTVPKNIRDFLGLTSGSSAVEFIIDEDGSVRVQKAQVRKARRPGAQAADVPTSSATNRCDRIRIILPAVYLLPPVLPIFLTDIWQENTIRLQPLVNLWTHWRISY